MAAAAGGVPELAEDGQNALLVSAENPVALSIALSRLLNDAELRTRLSAGGRRTARELAWNRIVERYEAVYAQARLGFSSN